MILFYPILEGKKKKIKKTKKTNKKNTATMDVWVSPVASEFQKYFHCFNGASSNFFKWIVVLVSTYAAGTNNSNGHDNKAVLPVQSGGCPVHVPFVVQCLVVKPDVLKPSQHA